MKHLPFITLCWIVSLGFMLTAGFYIGRTYEKKEEIMAIINKNKTEQIELDRMYFAGTYPTGYEVWDEANRYRVSKGKKELILDKRFCNNIGSRAQNYRKTNSHAGLEDFVRTYMKDIRQVSEILNWGTTAKEVVDGWASSPSHNLTLLDANRGCAYSDDGYSVMLLGY